MASAAGRPCGEPGPWLEASQSAGARDGAGAPLEAKATWAVGRPCRVLLLSMMSS
jgi:hypothetical protein